MARIRSIHPKFFTDEAVMGLSCEAQIFLIGLWTEVDDQGVFEWKPVTLRARLRPSKNGCVESILAELAQGRCIRGFEHDGRQFGAIRNFCKYQRPKRPSNRFVVPPELRTWVGLADAGTEQSGVERGRAPPKSESSGVNGGAVPPKSELTRIEGGISFAKGGNELAEGEEGGGRKREEEEGRKRRNQKDLPNESDDDRDSADEIGGSVEQKAPYAFVSGAIKLVEQDLDQWKRAFPNLSLEAELLALSEWAELRPNWFSAVSAALAKKQRAAVLALERVKAEATANGRPPPRDENDLWDHAL